MGTTTWDLPSTHWYSTLQSRVKLGVLSAAGGGCSWAAALVKHKEESSVRWARSPLQTGNPTPAASACNPLLGCWVKVRESGESSTTTELVWGDENPAVQLRNNPYSTGECLGPDPYRHHLCLAFPDIPWTHCILSTSRMSGPYA